MKTYIINGDRRIEAERYDIGTNWITFYSSTSIASADKVFSIHQSCVDTIELEEKECILKSALINL
ncbi:MAG: hypothetical protein Unbinned6805contig1000_33 [Prokaryotic dsDNA virus sp.]|nr:MAG: hypothetical protein Unbinned6805contig1000_33 [Prokaryotic dsDNA virus sp.]